MGFAFSALYLKILAYAKTLQNRTYSSSGCSDNWKFPLSYQNVRVNNSKNKICGKAPPPLLHSEQLQHPVF